VKVRLMQREDAVWLEIADNGCGSAKPLLSGSPEGRQHLGLIGMQERVRLVHGQLSIDSQPRRGTTVRVRIPLSAQPSMGRGTPSVSPLEPNRSLYHTSHEQNHCASCR
jgi:nitrate/nitrite-specific signal transduction histidine kinase